MVEQVADFLDSGAQLEELVQQAKGGGGATGIATQPWLTVLDRVEDLVHHLLPTGESDNGILVVL